MLGDDDGGKSEQSPDVSAAAAAAIAKLGPEKRDVGYFFAKESMLDTASFRDMYRAYSTLEKEEKQILAETSRALVEDVKVGKTSRRREWT